MSFWLLNIELELLTPNWFYIGSKDSKLHSLFVNNKKTIEFGLLTPNLFYIRSKDSKLHSLFVINKKTIEFGLPTPESKLPNQNSEHLTPNTELIKC